MTVTLHFIGWAAIVAGVLTLATAPFHRAGLPSALGGLAILAGLGLVAA